MQSSVTSGESLHKPALPCQSGEHLAAYVLDCVRKGALSKIPPGTGLTSKATRITIFKCKARLLFLDNNIDSLRDLCAGDLKLIFSSPARGLVKAPEGYYWDPASLVVSLDLVTETGTASSYRFFKGIQFKEAPMDGGPVSSCLEFNPVEFGEPARLFIKTKNTKTRSALYDHIKRIVAMRFV